MGYCCEEPATRCCSGADVNQLDPHGWAPIHLAIRRGYYNTVKNLIEKGADVNLRANHYDKRPPLQWAIDQERKEIELLLREHGAMN